jgi:hypothetical protein
VSGGVVVEKEREVVVSGVVGEVRVESPGFVEGMRFDKPEKVDGYEPKVNEAEIASVKFIAKLPKNDYYVEHAPFSMVGQSSSAWGLTGGFIDETLGGYRHEFLETAMSGSKLWLEIVQDGSCGVVSVIFKSGTSFPAVKVLDTGGTFAETLNVPWAEWDGGVVNQFRSGNCVLTIWDIDGYACRWPEMIGGRPCLA